MWAHLYDQLCRCVHPSHVGVERAGRGGGPLYEGGLTVQALEVATDL